MRNLSKPLNFVKAMERTLYPDNQGFKKKKAPASRLISLHDLLLHKKQKQQFIWVSIGFLVALFGLWQVSSQTLSDEFGLETNVSGKVMMQVAESGKNIIVDLAQWLIHYAL